MYCYRLYSLKWGCKCIIIQYLMYAVLKLMRSWNPFSDTEQVAMRTGSLLNWVIYYANLLSSLNETSQQSSRQWENLCSKSCKHVCLPSKAAIYPHDILHITSSLWQNHLLMNYRCLLTRIWLVYRLIIAYLIPYWHLLLCTTYWVGSLLMFTVAPARATQSGCDRFVLCTCVWDTNEPCWNCSISSVTFTGPGGHLQVNIYD